MDEEQTEGLAPEKIEVTSRERRLLKKVIQDFYVEARARSARGRPKGWTVGEVHDAIDDCKSLLAKLG